MTLEHIDDIIRDKMPADIPVIFGVDFRHVFPIITFSIGCTVKINAYKDVAEIQIITN